MKEMTGQMCAITRLRSHRRLGTILTELAAAAAAVAAVAAPASAATQHHALWARPGWPPAAGYVYLNDDTAGANTIAGFERHADGSLTPLPGSPFDAGGAGTGTGLASQGAIQTALDGRYELTVDAGSNQLSVLRTESDGSLVPVPGGVVSSGGVDPVSVAVHGNLVYVVNAGPAAPNLTGFVLTPLGQLIALPHATFPLPANSQPGDVLFNATGTKLVATLIGSSQIASYTVSGDGYLNAAAGSPYPGQGLGAFGSQFSPINPDLLFVSNPHNGTGLGTVSALDDGAGGTLSSIGASPYADGQTAPCWVAITPDGRYLFAVNAGSQDISRYAIAPDGTLTLLGTTPVSGTNPGPLDAQVSPDGRTLYVDESAAHAVGVFAVQGGDLTELPNSPVALPAGATAAGVSVLGPRGWR
jgi:6-phosphogluconolactonase